MNQTLEDLTKKYFDLQKTMEDTKKAMEELKPLIVSEMETSENKSYVTVEGIEAKIAYKDTFKYNDETGMIKYLEDNGFNKYIIKKIDTASFNKELKKESGIITESLRPMYTKTTTVSLSVREAK